MIPYSLICVPRETFLQKKLFSSGKAAEFLLEEPKYIFEQQVSFEIRGWQVLVAPLKQNL